MYLLIIQPAVTNNESEKGQTTVPLVLFGILLTYFGRPTLGLIAALRVIDDSINKMRASTTLLFRLHNSHISSLEIVNGPIIFMI